MINAIRKKNGVEDPSRYTKAVKIVGSSNEQDKQRVIFVTVNGDAERRKKTVGKGRNRENLQEGVVTVC